MPNYAETRKEFIDAWHVHVKNLISLVPPGTENHEGCMTYSRFLEIEKELEGFIKAKADLDFGGDS